MQVCLIIVNEPFITTVALSFVFGCSHRLMKKWVDELLEQSVIGRVRNPDNARKPAVQLKAKVRTRVRDLESMLHRHRNFVASTIGEPSGVNLAALPRIAARLRDQDLGPSKKKLLTFMRMRGKARDLGWRERLRLQLRANLRLRMNKEE